MGDGEKKAKWHKQHVTIDTPCRITELEAVLHAIGDIGGWCDAEIGVDGDKIVITFGNGPDESVVEGGCMQMINE